MAFMLNRLRVISHEDIGLADPQVPLLVKAWTEQAWDWNKSKNGAWRLALANTILLMCRSPKSREGDSFQCVGFENFEAGKPLAIPDYALCKHTRRGKALGRGIDHFRQVGATLNPAPVTPDQYEDRAYAIWVRKEKDVHARGESSRREANAKTLF
jgi:replication-associated recombination protein RarA